MANIDEIFAAHGFGAAPKGPTTGTARFNAIGNSAARDAARVAPKAKERSLGEKMLPAAGAIGLGLLAAPLTGGLSLPLAIALAGGTAALGGGLGELAAQKINEEDKANGGFDWEKFRNEGLISGAFGAGGAAIQGGRAAYGLSKAGMPVSKALTSSAASPAAAGLTSPKNLVDALTGVSGGTDDAAKVATSLRARGLGADELAKKEGSRGFTHAADIVKTADEYGIKSGTRGLKQSGAALDDIERQFQSVAPDVKISVKEANSVLDDLAKTSTSNVTDSTLQRTLNAHKQAIQNASKKGFITVSDLRDINSKIGSRAFSSDVASKDLGKEVYARYSSLIGKKAPDARQLLSEQSRLLDLESTLKGTTGTAKANIPFVGNTPIPGLAAVRDRSIDAATGIRGLGQKAMTGMTGAAIRGGVTQGVPRMFMGGGETAQDPAAEGYGQDTASLEQALMASGQDMGQEAPQQSSMYSLERALADAQRDPKNTEKYLSLYKTVSEAEGGGKNGPNVGKVSAQQYQLAQQGYNALNQFANLIQSDPGVVGRSATPGRSLPGVGGVIANATGTAEFDTLGFAAISSLLRAQSGAAVPDSEVRSYMKAYLPRPGDTPAVTQRKLQTLNYAYQTVFAGANNQGASGIDQQDLMMQGAF